MSDPVINKAARVVGDTLVFRNANVGDAEFILSLRTDAEKSKYLSPTSNDVETQRQWLKQYAETTGQAYFIIEYENEPIGTVRLYDAKEDSFCWGSWILKEGRPRHAAMESALMVYSYATDHLGFKSCHFDVRKGNDRVIKFHERFGAACVSESDVDYFFTLSGNAIREARLKYANFLTSTVRVERLMTRQYAIGECRLLNLPKISDPRGNLTFVESGQHVPFDIQRVYYLYDVPGGAERGGHAHKALHQLIVAMSGSFDVVLDDGREKRRFHLNRSYTGLYVCPMVWRELDNFSSGSVCMVLASNRYEESDYYRDYDEYLAAQGLK